MIPKAIDLVNNRINRQLSFGYDIGKGFVVAEEEVSKIIDQLVLDPKIAADLKMRCDFTRLQVVKSLGIFFACLFVCLFNPFKTEAVNGLRLERVKKMINTF